MTLTFLFQCVTMEGWTPILYWVSGLRILAGSDKVHSRRVGQADFKAIKTVQANTLVYWWLPEQVVQDCRLG